VQRVARDPRHDDSASGTELCLQTSTGPAPTTSGFGGSLAEVERVALAHRAAMTLDGESVTTLVSR
jgi:hypothetical protein